MIMPVDCTPIALIEIQTSSKQQSFWWTGFTGVITPVNLTTIHACGKHKFCNFVGCSRAYNIVCYPSLSHLDTEVNEQANSSISMLKSQLSYMNERNFFNHLKLFLWHRNQAKLSGMVSYCTTIDTRPRTSQ